jgi:hypothetical protein
VWLIALVDGLQTKINNPVLPLLELIEELRRRELPNGGWSPGFSLQASTEATCLAVLTATPHADWNDRRALQFLVAQQRRDGAWPAFAGSWGPSWATALATITFGQLGTEVVARQRALNWLIHTKGSEAHWLWRWKFKLADRQAGFNPDKYGWPWLPGASSWVIPTAFSLIALKQFVSCTPSEAARQRIRKGLEMLFDRACVGGGWNAGNRVVYAAPLTAHVEPTAIALMALQDEVPNQIILDSVAWLKRRVENLPAISSLAWSILSLFLYGVPVEELKRRLAGRIGDPSRVGDNAVLAVAALALQCGEAIHPFALIR